MSAPEQSSSTPVRGVGTRERLISRPSAPTPALPDAVERLLEQVVEDPEPQPLRSGHSLRDQCAIVTGGATGIGRVICLELARNGVHVAFNHHTYEGAEDLTEEAERTAREIAQLEVRVYVEECDVRDPDAAGGFVQRAAASLGGMHILVNNAGVSRDGPLWRLTDDEWRTVVDTNLSGAFYMIRAVAPFFRRQEDGKVINISSVHAAHSEFGLANYASSKAGLIALTRSAALELGPSNVNVNAIAPGYIRTTRLVDEVSSEVLDQARSRSALGRLGDPMDVAGVVLFLCSDAARHITGAVIPVDGGYSL